VAYLRGVVAFGVEEVRHLKGVTWAIGDTQLAALAALNNEVDFAVRYHNAVLVERLTPEFHGCLLLGGS
jgi:hypothetical protein